MSSNQETASRLRLMAKLMELHGGNAFKVRAYQTAAYNVERVNEDLRDLSADQLQEINGIGGSMAQKIQSILTEGTFPDLRKLEEDTPSGLRSLMYIKGIGPKKLGQIWRDLGVTSSDELLQAIEEKKIETLTGFSSKTQQNIKDALQYAREHAGFALLNQAEELSQHIIGQLKQLPLQGQIAAVGELRRTMETISQLDLQIDERDAEPVRKFMTEHYQKQSDEGQVHWLAGEQNLAVWLHPASERNWASELVRNTGSQAHIESLGELPVAGSEGEVYAKLGMQFIPPELREGEKWISVAKKKDLPELITFSGLKGCLHNHSTYSDGKASLKQMAEACMEHGLEYLGMTDHSQSAVYANGLKEPELLKQFKEIDELNAQYKESGKNFRIFKGIESDILNNGSLDYPADILKEFDFIVASVHSVLNMTKEAATKRLVTAIENPYTTVLGHPSARLLLLRQGFDLDYNRIIDSCASNNVSIEINSNPRRLDIDWRWAARALDKGVLLSINPDAHSTSEVGFMKYGVAMARKAGAEAGQVLNAKTADEFGEWLGKRK